MHSQFKEFGEPMLKQKLLKLRSEIFSRYESSRLRAVPFAFISNNCWGYELYHSIGREYNTPFIGLFMFTECYLQFLENFDSFINGELTFVVQSKYFDKPKGYPIGVVGDTIEIHFLHYRSQEEAREKWGRRCDRLRSAIKNGTPLYVKICDSEACTTEQLARFHALPFSNKISIGLQQFPSAQHFHLPEMEDKSRGVIIDGAKLFNKRYRYFDITHWILTSRLRSSAIAKLFAVLS